ncbi:IclR family transcriptional regulator [Streptomyces sp. GbtcB6]|uniref:IclR family transcriptional regulator n=1 Tax=Streptomyces sp. GbtcB6 TaxID=2824751 RepID=UPI001C2F1D28|nr:IclR family transcriptional regulator [Streptomyces sp. GbtcB6]
MIQSGPAHDEHAASSVAKAGAIFRAFSTAGGSASLTQIAVLTGTPKSTTHRLLAELIECGVIERDGRAYQLSVATLDLAAVARGGRLRDLQVAVKPFMAEVYARTRETVHLAILDHSEVLYLDRIPSAGSMSRLPTSYGARLPAHCTAIGKAMLAELGAANLRGLAHQPLPRLTKFSAATPKSLLDDLELTVDRGYAVSDQEAALGLTCLGIPIRNMGGDVVAAISISAPSNRFRERTFSTILGQLKSDMTSAVGWGSAVAPAT